ncbi:metallophosphoesterase [Nocardioides sp. LHG3406-4]|uniref:metallophosphoesterase n=1 Tax=Nocardioides sp. LHG3406-4 TaxID=2804575 RepID=UPI003CF99121
MTTVAFVGDIHGELVPLERLLEEVASRTSRFVFLGDYVNRGPQSKQVIDYLLEFEKSGARCDFLLGNHDLAFLRAIDEGRLDAFLRMGGAATLRSYGAAEPEKSIADRVPGAHVDFLRRLAHSAEGADFFAAHDAKAWTGMMQKFGVFGHQPQAGLLPTVTETYALIDTGCGTLADGRLTAFFWPSRDWVQAF